MDAVLVDGVSIQLDSELIGTVRGFRQYLWVLLLYEMNAWSKLLMRAVNNYVSASKSLMWCERTCQSSVLILLGRFPMFCQYVVVA